ncbi:hypothetical protein BP6252_06097 [Coleophoma cylindrospora]|uniref:Uncharacterized protein n=1 Tax=Coleophoma cylindrospora TaxID=1849047 RepID=A0A3D8RLM4_9HELO|nr:hypothetical protein BP6252_06097 [Coleophoma cylindrospora]
MASSSAIAELPNVNFGTPVIFFDSHPEEQESYLYSYYSSLKKTLKIAFTGNVPKPLEPGKLRLVWWTHDGSEGHKDYELHQYALVRDNFDGLLALPEIRRCLVTGFAGQNPYVAGNNPWEMDKKFARNAKLERQRMENTEQRLNDSKEGRHGTVVDIEAVIAQNEEAEKERVAENAEMEKEKHARAPSGEGQGLLSTYSEEV